MPTPRPASPANPTQPTTALESFSFPNLVSIARFSSFRQICLPALNPFTVVPSQSNNHVNGINRRQQDCKEAFNQTGEEQSDFEQEQCHRLCKVSRPMTFARRRYQQPKGRKYGLCKLHPSVPDSRFAATCRFCKRRMGVVINQYLARTIEQS